MPEPEPASPQRQSREDLRARQPRQPAPSTPPTRDSGAPKRPCTLRPVWHICAQAAPARRALDVRPAPNSMGGAGLVRVPHLCAHVLSCTGHLLRNGFQCWVEKWMGRDYAQRPPPHPRPLSRARTRSHSLARTGGIFPGGPTTGLSMSSGSARVRDGASESALRSHGAPRHSLRWSGR